MYVLHHFDTLDMEEKELLYTKRGDYFAWEIPRKHPLPRSLAVMFLVATIKMFRP